MGNVVIKVPPSVLHISPLGFHRYASEFLKAAQGFKINDGFSPVPYYLTCRSMELSLKAFLLAKGFPKKRLKEKNLGHDLEKILEKAISMGLDTFVSLLPQHKEELKKANKYYASKGFEYFEVIKAMTGYRNLPDISVLTDVAALLVSKLEPVCLQATDGPL
jgi:hypothetical protein